MMNCNHPEIPDEGTDIQNNEPKPGQRTPMEKLAQNIQEAFLNNARKDKTFLTIYLMSGVKLSGRIKSFDKYSLILETNNQEQLIFKHAISTVVTMKSGHAYGTSSQAAHSSAAAAQQALALVLAFADANAPGVSANRVESTADVVAVSRPLPHRQTTKLS